MVLRVGTDIASGTVCSVLTQRMVRFVVFFDVCVLRSRMVLPARRPAGSYVRGIILRGSYAVCGTETAYGTYGMSDAVIGADGCYHWYWYAICGTLLFHRLMCGTLLFHRLMQQPVLTKRMIFPTPATILCDVWC